jgi:uncharacterized protein (DUF4415 family)
METEYDFSNARRAKDVPHLAALRAKERGGTAPKQRISIMVEVDVLDAFRQKALARGVGYQTLMNEALKQAIDPASAPVTLGQLQAALSQWSHNSTSTKQS